MYFIPSQSLLWTPGYNYSLWSTTRSLVLRISEILPPSPVDFWGVPCLKVPLDEMLHHSLLCFAMTSELRAPVGSSVGKPGYLSPMPSSHSPLLWGTILFKTLPSECDKAHISVSSRQWSGQWSWWCDLICLPSGQRHSHLPPPHQHHMLLTKTYFCKKIWNLWTTS